MKRLEFVFFDAGGGHRSAATALASVIENQQRPWEVHLMNLQEVLDSLDITRRLTGIRIQDVYNSMLKSGWTLGSPQLMRILQAFIRLYHPLAVRRLEAYWRQSEPDMVVSFVPHFNRALCESLRRTCPGKPFVTVLTDVADYPPHFWMERQEQHFVCGSERAVAQARAMGHPEERIFQASGMILNPRFYDEMKVDRAEERQRLGLREDLPTGLMLFGGQGSRAMEEIVARIEKSDLNLQLILICGRNDALAGSLRQRKSRLPLFVEGFTKQVPYYMALSDFFIGKPGPGSLSEAFFMHLPAIVECNAWTLPQERYNAVWIEEKGMGLVVRSFRDIVPALARLLEPTALAGFRARLEKNQNRAVFEIPDMLEEVFAQGKVSAASAGAVRANASFA
ncbi:MAG TPA: glycosyltransferase [Candidatus Acidoferrales bacterium]|jgi:1,2-diacylglycerol 3-beta-galactosyltransferase|nr:glycosyltransferase [Candidatus Acidoferrales bacterium]